MVQYIHITKPLDSDLITHIEKRPNDHVIMYDASVNDSTQVYSLHLTPVWKHEIVSPDQKDKDKEKETKAKYEYKYEINYQEENDHDHDVCNCIVIFDSDGNLLEYEVNDKYNNCFEPSFAYIIETFFKLRGVIQIGCKLNNLFDYIKIYDDEHDIQLEMNDDNMVGYVLSLKPVNSRDYFENIDDYLEYEYEFSVRLDCHGYDGNGKSMTRIKQNQILGGSIVIDLDRCQIISYTIDDIDEDADNFLDFDEIMGLFFENY